MKYACFDLVVLVSWLIFLRCGLSLQLGPPSPLTSINVNQLVKFPPVPKLLAAGFVSSFLLFNPISVNLVPYISYAEAAILNDDSSMQRLKASLVELKRLDKDWTTVTGVAGAGDNIRRVLGTVYSPPNCDSPLCSSDKFVKRFITSHLDDIDLDSFEGPSSQYLEALKNADFLAYSSIFSEFSGGGGIGESSSAKYVDMSHEQVKKAIVHLTDMLQILESE